MTNEARTGDKTMHGEKTEAMRQWAQDLIVQLPRDHEGRNSWLLNHGVGTESDWLRAEHARYKQAWSEWRQGEPQPTRNTFAGSVLAKERKSGIELAAEQGYRFP